MKNVNKHGSTMKVVEYKNANNMTVEFYNGYKVKTTWNSFNLGEVKNPYDRTVRNVGFLGEGIYNKRKNSRQYATWNSMLIRCYDDDFHRKHPSYLECSVINDWHNFQNFAEWYDNNYYEVEGNEIHLDKDILIKGNKVYSPDTCIFVPYRINTLFLKSDLARGDLPLGVHFDKINNKYKAQCKIGKSKVKNLGRYNTVEEAFQSYKVFKEKYIKEIAEEYKERIPKKLYDAMYEYSVEITD